MAYLFSYFKGNGEDGLHLAYSADGLKFTSIKNDQSLLKPEVGESKLMRDPHVVRGPDGVFHMVWTTSWTGGTIGYASSKNLIDWSPQRAINVMGHEPTCRNCWAPETVIDEKNGHYVVIWSSTIPGRFEAGEKIGDDGYNHRLYCTTTTDWQNFTPTKLYYDPGFNVIDASFLRDGEQHYLVIKDETRWPEPKKHLRLTKADSVMGSFGPLSEPFTPAWVEGPSAVKLGDRFVIFFDCYGNHSYGAVASRDLKTWTDITHEIAMPKGARHGTVFEVPDAIAQVLLKL